MHFVYIKAGWLDFQQIIFSEHVCLFLFNSEDSDLGWMVFCASKTKFSQKKKKKVRKSILRAKQNKISPALPTKKEQDILQESVFSLIIAQ